MRSHLSTVEALLILCSMTNPQELEVSDTAAIFAHRFAVICAELKERGMQSVTSRLVSVLLRSPSARVLVEALHEVDPSIVPTYKPVQSAQSVAQPAQSVAQPAQPKPFAQPVAPVTPFTPAPAQPMMPTQPAMPATPVTPKPFIPSLPVQPTYQPVPAPQPVAHAARPAPFIPSIPSPMPVMPVMPAKTSAPAVVEPEPVVEDLP